MNPPAVIIATHNRLELLTRAVDSVIEQDPRAEVIVVDDYSHLRTKEAFEGDPRVRYRRLERNQGPGPARNLGLDICESEWALILDDDDRLAEGALDAARATLVARLSDYQEAAVVFFATSAEQTAATAFSFEDFFNGRLKGDFTPLINVKRFRQLGLHYPDVRLGGEHLLWWLIATTAPIPVEHRVLVEVTSDATTRLTSPTTQINRALEHAHLQEETLRCFGERLARDYPSEYRKRRLGAATYYLLAGERRNSLRHARQLSADGHWMPALMIGIANVLPRPVLLLLFKSMRRVQARTLANAP